MLAITGATGFIGRYLSSIIDEEFIAVTVENEEVSDVLKSSKAIVCSSDFSEKSLTNIFVKYSVTTIVHLAYIRPFIDVSYKAYLENTMLTTNIFQVACNISINNIVFISSRSIYGNNSKIPTKESEIVLPLNLYSLSKYHCEQIANYYNQIFDMKIKSLRLAPVYGIGDKSKNFMWYVLKSLKHGDDLLLYGDDIGQYEYIYVKDVANAILKATTKTDTYGVFNLGVNDNFKLSDIEKIINKIKPNIKILHKVNVKADNTVYLMDSSKFYKTFNWAPNYSLEKGLIDSYEKIKHD